MKQLFVFLGTACILVGAGLVVPGPALAGPFDCQTLQQRDASANQPLIYGIDEVNGPLVTSEGNTCIIPTGLFVLVSNSSAVDVYEPGSTPGNLFLVSDYADIGVTSTGCDVGVQLCAEISLRSDPGGAGTGAEGGLPARCGVTIPSGCDNFFEDPNTGIAQDPANNGQVVSSFGSLPCDEYFDPGQATCLVIRSDTESGEAAVPEPSSALLLGAVLPGLFGFRRLSRRDL